MWIDRLAGQQPGAASSQPNSRPLSPLPRRTSSTRGPYLTSQKSGSTPKSSSLSLASSESSSSVLVSSRRTNGSTLRQSTTIPDGPDPEEVLATLFGPDPRGTITAGSLGSFLTPKDLTFDFDFGGLSLRELAEDDALLDEFTAYRPQTIEECTLYVAAPRPSDFLTCTLVLSLILLSVVERDKSKFEELHRSIQACDEILSSVETNLTSFRNDLATVSADIESLQARSTTLNVKLENRKAVEKCLGPIVEELSVPPHVVSKIAEGHIDETWAKVLSDLDKRVTAQRKNTNQTESKAMAELGPLLEKLTLKVCLFSCLARTAWG